LSAQYGSAFWNTCHCRASLRYLQPARKSWTWKPWALEGYCRSVVHGRAPAEVLAAISNRCRAPLRSTYMYTYCVMPRCNTMNAALDSMLNNIFGVSMTSVLSSWMCAGYIHQLMVRSPHAFPLGMLWMPYTKSCVGALK
jgi:hypothetical protein